MELPGPTCKRPYHTQLYWCCRPGHGHDWDSQGTAKDAWDSIQMEWGKNADMWWSHAQEALNWTTYVEGTEIQEHIKLLQTQRAAADNLSTSMMSDETWRGVIIWFISPAPKWLPVIPSLYTIISSAVIISIHLPMEWLLEEMWEWSPHQEKGGWS